VTTATPRPWRQISVSDQNDRWTIAQAGVGHAFGDPSMFVGSRVRNAADAALIVEAVNAYDRLLRIEAAARALMAVYRTEREAPDSPIAALRSALQEPTEPRSEKGATE